MRETTVYTFNGEPGGSLEISSRVVRCLWPDGSVAWTNSFHTRQEAEDRYHGDIRAMHKNACYGWPES